MENNSNKKLTILVIVLSIAVIGLSGYIAYDKIINNTEKQKSSETEKTNENEITNCVLEDLNGEILSYPTANDNDVIIGKGNDNYDYKYNNYYITFSSNLASEEYHTDYDCLEIKDNNGKIIYSNNYVKTKINGETCDYENGHIGKTMKVIPTISNGKLYFVSISKTCYKYDEDSNWPYYSYNYIDLNGDATKVVNIQNMKLMMEGAAPDDLQCE